jgi:hypothetical protein
MICHTFLYFLRVVFTVQLSIHTNSCSSLRQMLNHVAALIYLNMVLVLLKFQKLLATPMNMSSWLVSN